ncbi:MAG: phosphohydrolase [Candidatus Marinimicrobia bacterium]|nr:phosphohydrolase [Candidatus Neomarinimicrobiota bacterium]|tara:strand:+ start:422 stop:1585 length:1164 start_codon:yes stop_codon:yes gene_type:complete
MFFIVALTVFLLMHGYVGWRLIPSFNLTPFYFYLAFTIIFILGFTPLIPILLRINGYESKIIDKISLIGYTSLGFFTLSFVILLAKDFLLQSISLFNSFFNIDQTIDESKRAFIKKSVSIGIIGLTGSATAYGFYNARKGPKIIKQNIFLKNLPSEFENFTIAQISDLHVGPTIKKPYVENVLSQISHLNPDMIAITGDLVDGSVENLKTELEPLKEMIAKNGTYFVTGNHEYYSGVDRWLQETDRLGMINLVNTNKIIRKEKNEICIAGITDFRAHQIKISHRSNPKRALKNISDDVVKIVLAHQPNSIHAVHDSGADLQLSGHTHGGQFFPFNFPTKLANIYLAGHYDHDGTQIYVNRGTGYWGPPLRLGIPSEITQLCLKKEMM